MFSMVLPNCSGLITTHFPKYVTVFFRFGQCVSIIRPFSSPKLKAQVSFSDRLSSVCHLFAFLYSSPEPLGQFQPTWQIICSNEVPRTFPREDNYELTKSKSLILQNHWANIYQTWHRFFVCLEFLVPLEIFSLIIGEATIAGEGLQILTYVQHL